MREGLKGLLLATAAFVAIPAGADWLVLKDGSRVETRGAWEVKGRLVVFTSADGSLASMRTNDVDLGASEQATEAALNQADAARRLEVEEPLPGSARKAPVLVLTDADVAHVVPDAEAAEDSEVATAAPGLRLVVGSWDQEDSPDGNGVMVVGTLRNDGANVATSIQLQVQVLDGQGAILGTTTAQLTSTSLGSGDVLNFRAHFPELAGFDTARFDISGREFRPAPPVTQEGELSADDALRDREPEPAVEP